MSPLNLAAVGGLLIAVSAYLSAGLSAALAVLGVVVILYAFVYGVKVAERNERNAKVANKALEELMRQRSEFYHEFNETRSEDKDVR